MGSAFYSNSYYVQFDKSKLFKVFIQKNKKRLHVCCPTVSGIQKVLKHLIFFFVLLSSTQHCDDHLLLLHCLGHDASPLVHLHQRDL